MQASVILNRFISILSLLLLASYKLMALSDSANIQKTNMIDSFDQINSSEIKTGLLLNKGFFLSEFLLNHYEKNKPLNIGLKQWNFLNSCIKDSKVNENFNLEFHPLSNYEKDSSSVVPIGVIGLKANFISDSLVIERIFKGDKVDDISYNDYIIFAATLAEYKFKSGDLLFSLSELNFLSNMKEDILSIEIDFADGRGYNTYPLSDNIISVKYLIPGFKSIRFKLITTDATFLAYTNISIEHLYCPEPTNQGRVEAQSSFLKSTSISGGEYLVYQGGPAIDKPIIIIEGFDILNEESAADLIQDYEEAYFTDHLRDNGYDVFTLSFDDPSLSMHSNAEVVKALVTQINSQKIGNYEGIIIGESMGGLVVREALKEMENNNIDHQIGLFISFDSPQRGAHIPVGLQTTLKGLIDLDVKSFWWNLVENISDFDFSDVDNAMQKLNSPAAKELLINHYNRGSEFIDYQNFLDNLGYPESCRKITNINSGKYAQYIDNSLPVNPTNTIEFFYLQEGGQCIVQVELKGRFCPVTSVAKEVSDADKWNACWHVSSKTGHQNYNSKFWANVPGSYNGFVNGQSNFSHNFCFIPTVSAIDLSQSLIDTPSGHLAYNENVSGKTRQDLVSNNLTPFDDIYGTNYNHSHIEVFSSVFGNIKVNEVMYANMYIQNREIKFDRDFEATNTIYLGSNASTSHIPQKMIEVGDVELKNGATVNLNAGQKVVLESGFRMEAGCKLNVSVGSLNTKSAKINPIEEIDIIDKLTMIYNKTNNVYEVVTVTDKSETQYKWQLIGDETNRETTGSIFELNNIPSGQYTLNCIKEYGENTISESIVINIENKTLNVKENPIEISDIDLSKTIEIQLYPNPSYNNISFKIQSDKERRISINLYDYSGRLIKTFVTDKLINSGRNELTFDTSGLKTGAYFAEISTQNYRSINKCLIIN